MRVGLRCVLCLAIHSVVANPTNEHTDGGYVTNFEDIRGWDWTWLNVLLENVVVPIPEQHLSHSGFNIDVTEFTCDNIRVGKLEFASKANEFSFFIDGTQMACSAKLSYAQSTVFVPRGSVSISARTSDINMKLGVSLLPNDQSLPIGAHVRTCSANSRVELDFGGLILGPILNLFRGRVESVVEGAIRSQLCVALTKAINEDFVAVLEKTAEALQPFVVLPSATPTPTLPSPLLDWTISPTMQTIRSVSQRLGPEGINQVTKSFEDASGRIFIPVPMSTTLSSSYAGLDAALLGFEITGLDSFQRFEPLEPSGKYELRSRLGLRRVNVMAVTDMKFVNKLDRTGQTHSIPLKLNLTVSMGDIDLAANALLAVYEDFVQRIEQIRVTEIADPGCWLSILGAMRLTNLGIQYSDGPRFFVSGYDSGFAKTASNLLMMFVDLFRKAIPRILATSLNAHAREATNRAIQQRVADMACARRVVTSEFEDLTEFAPFQLLRHYLDTSGAPINRLIHSALGGSVNVKQLIDRVLLSSSSAQLRATVSDFQIGLGEVTNFTIAAPIAKDVFVSRIDLADQAKPLSFGADISVAYSDARRVKKEAYRFTADLSGMGAQAELLLRINSSAYHSLSLGDLRSGAKVMGIIAELAERQGHLNLPTLTLTTDPKTSDGAGAPQTTQVPFYRLLNTVGLELFFERLPALVAQLTDRDDGEDSNTPKIANAVQAPEEKAILQGVTIDSSVSIGIVLAVSVVCLILGMIAGGLWESRRQECLRVHAYNSIRL
eukprot:c40146_g1_i1.p1 GENE.c40146_g1_i1~~c40146_g1_i1.p1  ORF type:complete len:788 (+),score=190.79 c40146_g1_i1:36-2366(+)